MSGSDPPLIERLQTIRVQLRTGAVGQREVWEEWLAEAADELDQLAGSKNALQVEIERLREILDGTERRECEYLALIEKHATEVERLKAERHTVKHMLEDLLDRHGAPGG